MAWPWTAATLTRSGRRSQTEGSLEAGDALDRGGVVELGHGGEIGAVVGVAQRRKVQPGREGPSLTAYDDDPDITRQFSADLPECVPHRGSLCIQDVGPAQPHCRDRPITVHTYPWVVQPSSPLVFRI